MADAKGSYIGGAPVLFKDVAARAMISDEYNPAKTYTEGSLRIRNGKIYKAVKETTGDWDATAWKETSLTQIQAENAQAISALNARTNVLKIYFGVSAVEFNSGVGWLAYPQELWKYTSEPIVLANLHLQSGQNTGVNVYTGNTLTGNHRVEFYIDPSITRNIYVSYIFALRN